MKDMHFQPTGQLETSSDMEQIARFVPLKGARLLELGCGSALITRQIAKTLPVAEIIATDVDRVQHEKNLKIDDLPKVTFKFGGAEAIDLPDVSVVAPVESNAVFVDFPGDVADRLREMNWQFYDFIGSTSRLMCSWATTEQEIDAFVGSVSSILPAADHVT